jgi:hypothetical protein
MLQVYDPENLLKALKDAWEYSHHERAAQRQFNFLVSSGVFVLPPEPEPVPEPPAPIPPRYDPHVQLFQLAAAGTITTAIGVLTGILIALLA